ncbi:hypothetical protein HRbin35_00249 [bacterium HR35]|nr:hypothetical protein HRbin35_00249 [bacterium HR35]
MKNFKILKSILFLIYFLSPLFVWLLIFLQGENYLVIFKREEITFFLATHQLIYLILLIFFLQLANLIFYLFFNRRFFGKIIFVFVLLHLFLALKVYFFNYY